MSRSKAPWDTFSNSPKHSKCPKHSSNKCTCNHGSTNIPKTRLAALGTSGICWPDSAVDRGGALRRPLPPRWQQHAVAFGSEARHRPLGQECLKCGKLASLLMWSASAGVTGARAPSGGPSDLPPPVVINGSAGPSLPAADHVDCQNKRIITAVEKIFT